MTPVIRRTKTTPVTITPAIFRAWCTQHGLPEPVSEWRFAPPRRWRFDYAWMYTDFALIALEVEGGVWTGGRHTRGAGFLHDIEKYNEAALMGWRVLRCTPSTLCSAETLTLLRRALL